MANFFERLQERGLVQQVTDEELSAFLDRERTSMYIGFDPTADSLHVGSLIPMMCLAHAQRTGIRPVILIGGGTGMIGDPSGKSEERNLQTEDQIASNIEGLRPQFERVVSFEGECAAKIVNNLDWLDKFSYIEWLRDVGKHFSVNYMMAKDSVRSRLQDREQGISYTEFSYMLLQAYDFHHLYEAEDCQLQCGGNDQWGNITAGIELIRRLRGKSAYGMTFPLLTTASGTKFGKTEKGTVWLDAKRTTPYQFYQFWIRSEDADVGKLLRFFTFLDMAEIAAIETEHGNDPGKRAAQNRLAEEVTRLLHGDDAVDACKRASAALFGGPLDDLQEGDFELLASGIPTTVCESSRREDPGTLIDLLAETKVCPSKGQARRDLTSGGIYLNNQRESDPKRAVTGDDLLFGHYLMLRKGRKTYHLVDFSG